MIVLWDDNEISIDGNTNLTTSDDHCARFEASGWHSQKVDGHDPVAINRAISRAKKSKKPSFIACKTIIGFGAPTKGGTHHTHGAPLGEDEIKKMRQALNWEYPAYVVPKEILLV